MEDVFNALFDVGEFAGRGYREEDDGINYSPLPEMPPEEVRDPAPTFEAKVKQVYAAETIHTTTRHSSPPPSIMWIGIYGCYEG